MKKIMVLMVFILSVSVLPAFGAAQLTGKYPLTAMIDNNGKPADVKQFQAMAGGNIVLEFLGGGKCKMSAGKDEAGSCAYTLDGNKISLTVAGDKEAGVVDGNKIIISGEGKSKMIYEKK